MINVDKEMPEYCARCPLMVVFKGTDFMPTFLCKLEWRKLDGEYICKNRADFCPLKEVNK